jgi:hypothetical protein
MGCHGGWVGEGGWHKTLQHASFGRRRSWEFERWYSSLSPLIPCRFLFDSLVYSLTPCEEYRISYLEYCLPLAKREYPNPNIAYHLRSVKSQIQNLNKWTKEKPNEPYFDHHWISQGVKAKKIMETEFFSVLDSADIPDLGRHSSLATRGLMISNTIHVLVLEMMLMVKLHCWYYCLHGVNHYSIPCIHYFSFCRCMYVVIEGVKTHLQKYTASKFFLNLSLEKRIRGF